MNVRCGEAAMRVRVLCRREGLAQCGWGLCSAGALLLFGRSSPRVAFSNSPPHLRQAVGGGEEGTPNNPPQLPPGTASRLACFAGRRCRLGPTPYSCASHPQPEPPRHWPPSRGHYHRQTGATTPIKPVITLRKHTLMLLSAKPIPSLHVVLGWDFLPGE